MPVTNDLAYSDNRKVLLHWWQADDETNEDSETDEEADENNEDNEDNEDDKVIEGEDYPGVDLGPML